MQINQEKQLGSKTDLATQGPSMGKKSFKTSDWKKPVGVVTVGETPILTGEFIGEAHGVLERTQNHPPGNQHQKGPICLWVAGKWLKVGWEQSEWHCSLSDPSPTYSITEQSHGLPRPGEHLRLCPLLFNRPAESKKNIAQMKEQIKAPEKIQLSDEEIANYNMQCSKNW